MRTPESVYLDEGSGYLFVSQIDGQPNEKDGKGRISKLGLDGSVVTADWFTALNAPKGLRSFGGTLWVADMDEVIGIDIAAAKETARIKIDGAQFLNDVATGADGTVGSAVVSRRPARRRATESTPSVTALASRSGNTSHRSSRISA